LGLAGTWGRDDGRDLKREMVIPVTCLDGLMGGVVNGKLDSHRAFCYGTDDSVRTSFFLKFDRSTAISFKKKNADDYKVVITR
jgi:hypothetical protein